MFEIIGEWIANLALTNPEVAAIIMAVGLLRIIVKPVVATIDKYVSDTPTKTDDESWSKFKSSKAFTIFCFILDWTTSIKLKK